MYQYFYQLTIKASLTFVWEDMFSLSLHFLQEQRWLSEGAKRTSWALFGSFFSRCWKHASNGGKWPCPRGSGAMWGRSWEFSESFGGTCPLSWGSWSSPGGSSSPIVTWELVIKSLTSYLNQTEWLNTCWNKITMGNPWQNCWGDNSNQIMSN